MIERKRWVDISKGIATILVIFEHSLLSTDWLLAKVILLFHMPFFFFISGYCCNIRAIGQDAVKNYVQKNVIKTIKVVGVIGCISFPFYTLKSIIKGEFTVRLLAEFLKKYIYGNSVLGCTFGGVLVYCNTDVVQNNIYYNKKI